MTKRNGHDSHTQDLTRGELGGLGTIIASAGLAMMLEPDALARLDGALQSAADNRKALSDAEAVHAAVLGPRRNR